MFKLSNVQASVSFEGVEKKALEGMHKIIVASVTNNILKSFEDNLATLFQVGGGFGFLLVLVMTKLLHQIC